MVSSLEKSPAKLHDDFSLPESHQDAATTSSISNLGANKPFKFISNKNKRIMADSPLMKQIADDSSHPDDASLPNSKTSLSRKHHDNLSNTSKSSLKEEGLYNS